MRIGQGRGKARAALVAALLLVLQSLVSAFAAGAAASAAPLDIFGNPLCVSGADGSAHPDGHGAGLPPCCTPGCSMASGVPGAPAEGAALLAPFPLSLDASAPRPCASLLPGRKHRPGNARAPPPAV